MTAGRRARVALAAVAALVIVHDGVRAEDVPPAHRARSEFWERVASPGAPRARELVAAALEWHARAQQARLGPWEAVCESRDDAQAVRDAAVKSAVAEENALARLERAHALDPESPEVLYAQALVTSAWERPELGCSASRRSEEALALYDRVAAEAPWLRPETVAFERGLVLTTLGRTDEAAASYARAESLATFQPEVAALAAGNRAEQHMLGGDLPAAVAAYDRAVTRLDVGGGGGDARALALFGRALALERLGEHEPALDSARRALSAAGDAMTVLRAPGTFFVPRHEVHAYEALAQEARPDGPPLPVAAARASPTEPLFDALDSALGTPCAAATVARTTHAAAPFLDALAHGAATDAPARTLRLALRDHARACAARAPDATAARDRARRLLAAARSWSRFLSEGGADGRFAASARASVARLATDLTHP